MRNPKSAVLSDIEKEIIAEIRNLRATLADPRRTDLLEHPERLLYHFIQASHGNVKLRIKALAPALGSEIRTLQRAFTDEYHENFTACQARVRLQFSCWSLSISPSSSKISAIASVLGYARVQDFNRFFKKYMKQSPAEWGRKERERLEREKNPPSQ